MAIVNRDLDASQQRDLSVATFGAVANGLTLSLFVAPVAQEVQAVKVSAIGLSGAATGALFLHKFGASGVSIITGGWTTLTIAAIGTSGLQSFVQVASGSSLIQMNQGDVLMYTSGGGSGAALAALSVAVVVKNLVDIKNQFNGF